MSFLLTGHIDCFIILLFIRNSTISIISLRQLHLSQDLLSIHLMHFCKLYQFLLVATLYQSLQILSWLMEQQQVYGQLVFMIISIQSLLKGFCMLVHILFITSHGGKILIMARYHQFVIDFMALIVILQKSQILDTNNQNFSKISLVLPIIFLKSQFLIEIGQTNIDQRILLPSEKYYLINTVTKNNDCNRIHINFMGNELCINIFDEEENNLEPKTQLKVSVLNPPKKQISVKAGYKGQLWYNLNHGYGVQTWEDGSSYEGDWIQGKADGKGKYTYPGGDVYEGQWKEDQMHGKGTYYNKENYKYEGNWVKNVQDGEGKESYPDGSIYVGEFRKGMKYGQGKYVWSKGTYYEGQWIDNNMSGLGQFHWSDGRVYKGTFQCNEIHGQGIYKWKDGKSYQGQYCHNQKHGYGVYQWGDGRKHEGLWRNGKIHGKGKRILSNGHEREGIWKQNKRIKWTEQQSKLIKQQILQERQ